MKNIYKIILGITVAVVAFEGYLYYSNMKSLANTPWQEGKYESTLNPIRYLMNKEYEREITAWFKSSMPDEPTLIPLEVRVSSYTKEKDGSVHVRASTSRYNSKLSEEENQDCCGLYLFVKKDGVWKSTGY